MKTRMRNERKSGKRQDRAGIMLAAALACAATVSTSACGAVSPTAPAGSDAFSSQAASGVPYEERPLVRIATLKGPTGMGMVKLFDENDSKQTANRYETLIVGTPDEIVGKISSGAIDIAAVPTNLAATLYNKTSGGVQLLALNTLGVLYILEKGGTVSSVADLKGKTLYASGQGATPEYILDYILEQNGIDPEKDLTIEYKAEHTELMTLAASGMADLVLLPEPFVTTLLGQDKGFAKKIDLTVEWEKATQAAGISGSVLAMGGLIVRKEFAENDPDAVRSFLTEYKASVDYVNAQPAAAAQRIVRYGIMASAALAEAAIPSSHIVYVDGAEMKAGIRPFYQILLDTDPKSIGGSIPPDDFYYMK